MKLCIPAKIYLILSLLSVSLYFIFPAQSLFSVIFQAVMVIFWTWLLQYLCSNGYNTLSWGLVIFSAFFTIISILGELATASGLASSVGTAQPTTTSTKQ